VVGGSGDYLDEADTVLTLDAFRCHEVTGPAREVAAAHPTGRLREAGALEFGTGRVELAAVEMLVSEAQLRAAGEALVLVAEHLADNGRAFQRALGGRAPGPGGAPPVRRGGPRAAAPSTRWGGAPTGTWPGSGGTSWRPS
jgi:hypothetical protein